MVPHEWVEGSQSGPSSAKSLGRVAGESTNVRSDHGNLVDGCEVENTSDAETILLPGADIVTEPLAYILTKTDKL